MDAARRLLARCSPEWVDASEIKGRVPVLSVGPRAQIMVSWSVVADPAEWSVAERDTHAEWRELNEEGRDAE